MSWSNIFEYVVQHKKEIYEKRLIGPTYFGHLKNTISKINGIKMRPSHTRSTSIFYELSPSMVGKQNELLEKKYGGDRARHAALVIQKAFRHYMLFKKFAQIRALAKNRQKCCIRSDDVQCVQKVQDRIDLRSKSLTEELSECSSLQSNLSIQSDLNYFCSYYYENNYSHNDMKGNEVPKINLEMADRLFYLEDTTKELPDKTISNFLYESTHYDDSDTDSQTHSSITDCNRYSSICSFSSAGFSSIISKNEIFPENTMQNLSISFHSLREYQNIIDDGKKSDNNFSFSSGLQNWNQMTSSADSAMLSKSINSLSEKSQVFDVLKKRQYRIGLNIFNMKPSKGIFYLVRNEFLKNSPRAVAKFLIDRKGLSKQMIGEYLGEIQDPFNTSVLKYFAREIDLSGMQIDEALRKFQTYFRMPGEAQKIERIMEVFSRRYCRCNWDVVAKMRNLDTVFILAFAIIMLNTDLHTPNLKPERRMKMNDFIKNLRGIDDCCDIDRDMLVGIYERIQANEFKTSIDHVTHVIEMYSAIVGNKPYLPLPHRRLVCKYKLYKVNNINKKERPGAHQRGVFLFNDLLVITKILSKCNNHAKFMFRDSHFLNGLIVSIFQMPHYQYGIKLTHRKNGRPLILFNARNNLERHTFVKLIRESICEADEMENLRIESELERQKKSTNSTLEKRKSRIAACDLNPILSASVYSTVQHPNDSVKNHPLVVPKENYRKSSIWGPNVFTKF